MGFPSNESLVNDPHNIQPFSKDMYQKRPFLFRIDPQIGDNSQRAMIIVQSHIEPNWDYAFHNAKDFLATKPEVKLYQPQFLQEMHLRFRILVNPSTKSSIHKSTNLDTGEVSKHGKRIALTWDAGTSPQDAICDWFCAKTANLGFQVDDIILSRLNWVSGTKMITDSYRPHQTEVNYHRLRFRAALLEGTLLVNDVDKFAACVATGIGSGKSMGFGLLSVIAVG
jgi:CRISPR-associated protein Cas6/Cse3/CasE subtype I-E